LPPNGTDPLSNNPGGPSTPVRGAVLAWSLYNGGETVASASVTTWDAGAASSASGGGSAAMPTSAGGGLCSVEDNHVKWQWNDNGLECWDCCDFYGS
jgi:hypothetical protein